MALPYQQEQEQNKQTAIQPNQAISPGSQFIKTSQGIQKAATRRTEDVAAVREAAPIARQSDTEISSGAAKMLEAAKAKKQAAMNKQAEFQQAQVPEVYNKNLASASSGIKVDPSDVIKGPRFTVGNTTYVTKNPDTAKGEVLLDPSNPNNNVVITDILKTLKVQQNPDGTFVVNGQKLTAPQAYAQLFNVKMSEPNLTQDTPEGIIKGTSLTGPLQVSSTEAGTAQAGGQAIAGQLSGITGQVEDQQTKDLAALEAFKGQTSQQIKDAASTAVTNTISDILSDQSKQIVDVTKQIESLAYTPDGKQALLDLSKDPEKLKDLLSKASTPAERMSVMQELSRLRDIGVLITQEQGLDEIENWKKESSKMYERLDTAKSDFIKQNTDLINKTLPEYADKNLAKALDNFNQSLSTARNTLNMQYDTFRNTVLKPVVDTLTTIKSKLESIPAEQEAAARGALTTQALAIAGADALPPELANASLKDIYAWAEKSWQDRVMNSDEYKQYKQGLEEINTQDAKLNKFLDTLASQSFGEVKDLVSLGLNNTQMQQLRKSKGLDITGDDKVDSNDIRALGNVGQLQNQLKELEVKKPGVAEATKTINENMVSLGYPRGDYSSLDKVKQVLVTNPKLANSALSQDEKIQIEQRLRLAGQQKAFSEALSSGEINNLADRLGISKELLNKESSNIFETLRRGGSSYDILSGLSSGDVNPADARNLDNILKNSLIQGSASGGDQVLPAVVQAAANKIWQKATEAVDFGDRGTQPYENYINSLNIQTNQREQQKKDLQNKIDKAAKLKETLSKMATDSKSTSMTRKNSIIESLKKLGRV